MQHYRERRLYTQLDKLCGAYAFILLECLPNLGVITANAIYTAERILIPTTYGRYALGSIEKQLDTVRSYMLATVIRMSEAINQAQISGEPVAAFNPEGHDVMDFQTLTEEVLRYDEKVAV